MAFELYLRHEQVRERNFGFFGSKQMSFLRGLGVRVALVASLLSWEGCVAPSTNIFDSGPSVRLGEVRTDAHGLRTLAVELELELFNPALEPYRVSKILYTVDTGTIAGRLEGERQVEAIVESQQQVSLVFEIEIPLEHDPEAYRSLLNKNSYPVSVAGSVALDDGSLHTFAGVQTNLRMPKLPQFLVQSASLSVLAGNNLEFDFVLRLRNSNLFAVFVRSVDFKILADGKDIAVQQEAGVGTRLEANAAEDYRVRVVLDDSTHPAIKQVLTSGEVDYRIVGEAIFSNLVMPFDLTSKIRAKASGTQLESKK